MPKIKLAWLDATKQLQLDRQHVCDLATIAVTTFFW